MTSSVPIADPRWDVPHVLRGATVIRDAIAWTDGQRLAAMLNGQSLAFRIGRRQSSLFGNRVQFEKDCQHVQSTVDDFLRWSTPGGDQDGLPADHPLREYSNEEHFAYADYMHLPELLGDGQHSLIDIIDWSEIGLKDRDGRESTLWIGSQGSHTPCHYDTYGINFVAQIVGRKRWLLFPRDSPIGQLQTRIPYEESSVYIDFEPGTLHRLKDMDVYEVILEPGDVLFVPKHWWHYVSSMDALTISVNSWLKQPDDHVEQIKEMLVRQIITAAMVAHDCVSEEWLNHNEVVTDPSTNLTILSSLIDDSHANESDEPTTKRARLVITPAAHVRERRLTSIPFGTLGLPPPTTETVSNDALLKRLIRAMTERDTIDLIYNKLQTR